MIAGICNRIDKVIVSETADTTFYDSPDTERPVHISGPVGAGVCGKEPPARLCRAGL